jgi:hypothetical protein
MANLASQGIDMNNYFGVMHPPQTNYISSIAGELCNVTSDNAPNPLLPQHTIVDLIEAAPVSLDWRAYMESYGSTQNSGHNFPDGEDSEPRAPMPVPGQQVTFQVFPYRVGVRLNHFLTLHIGLLRSAMHGPASTPKKLAGVIPMISNGCPSSVSALPTADRLPPNWRCQNE